MQKFKLNGQSVPKMEWKQTDGQTDGRTEAIALPPTLMRSVIKHDQIIGYTLDS